MIAAVLVTGCGASSSSSEGTNLTSDRPSLKQFGTLTSQDFADYPVWVFSNLEDQDKDWFDDAVDEGELDEETARPWTGPLPIDPNASIFLVQAQFTLADGSSLSGFVTPLSRSTGNSEESMGTAQPHLFMPSGALVGLWQGMFPDPSQLDRLLSELGKSSSEVFPISWSVDPTVTDGVTTGVLQGFYPLDTE